MVFAIFFIGSIALGALLQICFRRFSWSYLFVSIVLSAVAFEGARFALGEIRLPFPPEFIVPVVVYDLIPWLIFAFLPLQIGYFGAMSLRLHLFHRGSASDDSH